MCEKSVQTSAVVFFRQKRVSEQEKNQDFGLGYHWHWWSSRGGMVCPWNFLSTTKCFYCKLRLRIAWGLDSCTFATCWLEGGAEWNAALGSRLSTDAEFGRGDFHRKSVSCLLTMRCSCLALYCIFLIALPSCLSVRLFLFFDRNSRPCCSAIMWNSSN